MSGNEEKFSTGSLVQKTTEHLTELLSLIEFQFKELHITFNKENFLKQSAFLDDFQVEKSIKFFINTIHNIPGDFDAKREIYHTLRHLHEKNTLICLADNILLFKEIEEGLSDHELVTYAMISVLSGAKKIAEYLFDKHDQCNPKKNKYMISYAICSQDTEWVLSLIKKWAIDITIPDYCFLFYVDKYKNTKLKEFFSTRRKDSKDIPTKNLFFNAKKSDKKDIPSTISKILENQLKVAWEDLEKFSPLHKKIILNILNDSKLTAQEAASSVKEIEKDLNIKGSLSYFFKVIFCARHIEKWHEIEDNVFKMMLIDNLAKLYMEISNEKLLLKEATHLLKRSASDYTSILIKSTGINNFSRLTKEEEQYKKTLITKSTIKSHNF